MPREHEQRGSETVLFGVGSTDRVGEELARAGAERVMTVGGGRMPEVLDRVVAALGDRFAGSFTDEVPQVPRGVADGAVAEAKRLEADWVLALGGGTAVGVAKAVALEADVSIAAIPTTYAGSERTPIWGITEGGVKTTGRDERVRPKLVIYDPALTVSLPVTISLPSLLNALAHSVEALYAVEATDEAREAARESLAPLFNALAALAADPHDLEGRAEALYGSYRAGTALAGASMGIHHKLCHVFGGSFGTPHAQTHAVILPYVVAFNAGASSAMREALREAFGSDDPAAALYDRNRQLGVPVDLMALGVKPEDVPRAVELALQKQYDNPRPVDAETLTGLVMDIVHGRRPSVDGRRLDLSDVPTPALPASLYGASIDEADAVVIAVHGRGANADRFARDLRQPLTPRQRRLADERVALIAPQAWAARWYPKPFTDPPEDNQPDLDRAFAHLDAAWKLAAGRPVMLAGFSQGACLLLAWLESRPEVVPAMAMLIAGAGFPVEGSYDHLAGVPVELSVAANDPWIPAEVFAETRQALEDAGVALRTRVREGEDHGITAEDEEVLRQRWETLMSGDDLEYQAGFGNTFATEARAGALPRDQNAPREVPFGLIAEQINGTGFTLDRVHNQRTWMYRLRPQILDRAFSAATHPRFTGRFGEGRVSPQVMRFEPRPLPTDPTDWYEGLVTFAGAGDPAAKRGMAVHLYTANRSMERRAFCNVDGDLLIVPEHGRLKIQTELGWLAVAPTQVAIVPRGIRFRVELVDEAARGWVAELFDGHFQLPNRGVVGANGLADERHFLAPVAAFEDVEEAFEIVVKQGGDLWSIAAPHSPFDVVAWHGNYAPYSYDLTKFNSLGSVSFDHADPSILTVLTCPGPDGNAIDFGVFQRRYDVTEHTFRPPYFHRNAAVEFNGVVKTNATKGPWRAGTFTYTPYHTPHGISARGVKAAMAASDEPELLSEHSVWIQFESTYALRVMPWIFALDHRDDDYLSSFSGYPTGKVD